MQNEYIKQLCKLKTAAGRKKAGQFMVEGKKLCLEALRSGQQILKCLVTDSELHNPLLNDLPDHLIIHITDHIANKLTDMETCPGIFMVIKASSAPIASKPNFILALDDPKRFAGVFEGVN